MFIFCGLEVELNESVWTSKAQIIHIWLTCESIWWLVFSFSNLGQHSKYSNYSKYMHLSEWDKSSKGQEFHKHPRKWSIEETVNNSSPGQLEYFIKSP